jgi:hypothetical protein
MFTGSNKDSETAEHKFFQFSEKNGFEQILHGRHSTEDRLVFVLKPFSDGRVEIDLCDKGSVA